MGLTGKVGSVVLLALAAGAASGTDWPMYRFDARRSAASPEELPRELHLQWVKQYPQLEPAWPDQPRLRFDAAYEPIAAGGMLFFGSSANDSVTALDAATGKECWRFYADGPVRFAPAFAEGRLYFVCDDGCLYCLDAASGKLLWKFFGGPGFGLQSAISIQQSAIVPPGRERLVLGNGRLVNLWVARGAPVVHEGRVYFAAGIWPFEGVFIHALDARTGEVVWTNDGSGALYMLQPHYSPAFGGVAPQGYLAVAGDRLLVPCGRSVPACFDLASGKFLYYRLAANQKLGGFVVAANHDSFANGGLLFDLAEGDYVGKVGPSPVICDDVAYGSDGAELCAYDVRERRRVTEHPARLFRRWTLARLWKHRIVGQVHIKAGGRLYAGVRNRIEAIDIPQGRAKPKVSWQARIAGAPATMLAADGRLFVSTLEGYIYCFGAARTSARLPEGADDVLVPLHAPWRYLGDGHEPPAGWRSASFDDRRWALGPPEPPDEAEAERKLVSGYKPPKKRFTSTYFRHVFQASPGAYAALRLQVHAEDGAVVFLNGIEVWRKRAPDPFSYWTAVSARGPEEVMESVELDPAALVPGANAIAVELISTGHNPKPPSFDLELVGIRTTEQPTTKLAMPPEDESTRHAQDILRAAGVSEGYALVLGLRDGRLAEELAARSRLRIVALDPDPSKVEAAGLLGRRIAIRHGDPSRLALPPYFASLIVSEDLADSGAQSAIWNLESGIWNDVFASLRPYGGAACLPLAEAEHQALARWASEPRDGKAVVERSGGLSVLRREGPLPGAGEWTHQNADAANTCVSKDERVRLPLGILWFGGSSNEKTLPRHGHGPSPQIVGGRLFIEGPDGLRAMDIYTGRILWEVTLPGLGEAYDNTEHQPGANALGSNYASAPDGIYVAYGRACLRLDPATGERLAEFALPHLGGGELPPAWGFISLWDDVLVAGTSPADFDTDPDFTPDEFGATSEEEAESLLRWLGSLRGFSLLPRRAKERDGEFIARNLNALLARTDIPSLLPRPPSSKARTLASGIAAHLKSRSSHSVAGRELKRLNRLLLEEHLPSLPRKRVLAGKPNIYSGTASRWLVALNRYSGKVLWTREARDGFLHNSIAIGRNKLFCLDRLPEGIVRSWRWHGAAPAQPKFQLLALDARTGSLLWSASKNIFGTWLAYSEDHDVLLQAARASRDMLPEPTSRMIAYVGESGTVLWDKPHRYGGPCMLHGDTIITQEAAYDLLTGERRMRRHPLTGEEMPWTFTRDYGCGTAIAGQHLLTFRSGAAGYFDLARDGGTGTFGGFRSGCTANLIPAGGLLNAPDYTRTCTCSYQNQCSLALVHVPEVETWTFNYLKRSDEPLRRVGINLGAPGDRRADDGTLWLDFPRVGGPSPHVPVIVQPDDPEWFSHHSSRIVSAHSNHQSSIGNRQSAIPWVAASGAKGIRSLTITIGARLIKWRREHPTLLSRWRALAKRPKSPPLRYTVRLHFVEPDGAGPGERVFRVSLQGEPVIEALDIAAEAGGPWRPLVKEFPGVEIGDELKLEFAPSPGATRSETVLCGIELVAED